MQIHHSCSNEDYIDLTAMDFEPWVRWLFTTDHSQWHDFCVSEPQKLLEYVTRLFNEFPQWVEPYTQNQIDEAIWFLLGAQLELGEYLMDKTIPLVQRLACLRAMYHPFADYLCKQGNNYQGGGFFMWWDLIIDNHFCGAQLITLDELKRRFGIDWGDAIERSARSRRPLKETLRAWEQLYREIDPDHRALLDETLNVLKRILALGEPCCEGAALHGLGHLWHPKSWEVVQAFIHQHRASLDEESLRWLRNCRDGVVM